MTWKTDTQPEWEQSIKIGDKIEVLKSIPFPPSTKMEKDNTQTYSYIFPSKIYPPSVKVFEEDGIIVRIDYIFPRY